MKLARFHGDTGWREFDDGHTYRSAAVALVQARIGPHEHTFDVGIHVQVKDPDVGVIRDITVTPFVEYAVNGLRG